MDEKLTQGEKNLRERLTKYNEAKQALNAAEKQQTGSLGTRDLHTVFPKQGSKDQLDKSWFPTGDRHMKSWIAIVPHNMEKDFLNNYERLSEEVVPKSAKKIPVNQDIGQFYLYRVVSLEKTVEDIKSNAKKWLKVTMREFVYSPERMMGIDSNAEKLKSEVQKTKDDLSQVCQENYKGIYATYAHLKVLKAFIDISIRNSSDYKIFILNLQKGRDRKVIGTCSDYFAPIGKKEFYGFKEDTGEVEDFFPFSLSTVDMNLD